MKASNLHYGDTFIFLEDHYEANKAMVKVTSDALFDYWQRKFQLICTTPISFELKR